MKKKGIVLLALLMGLCMGGLLLPSPAEAASRVKIDKKHFPGKIFREYVKEFDKNKDGYLSKKESKAVKRITLENGEHSSTTAVKHAPILNLAGLEYFTQAEEFRIVYYRLKNLKLDKMKNLKMVYFVDCKKVDRKKSDEEYDFIKNKKLEEVYLYRIGGAVKEILFAQDNKVRRFELDVPNKMAKLDLSRLSRVEELRVAEGPVLESIDLLECKLLKKANISYNKELTTLNFSGNPNLEELTAFKNHLTSLDISKNRKLKYLMIASNYFSELDVSKNTALQKVNCSNNLFEMLDISMLKKLRSFTCYGLKLQKLNLKQNTKLESLDCHSNLLENLDLSANIKLSHICCGANPLEILDVSMLTELTGLLCDYTRLTTLDVSKNRKLDSLSYLGNRIPFIDLTGHSVRVSNTEAVAKMQKSQLLPIADNSLEEGIQIDKEHFPDYALRYEVLADFDTNHDGILSEKESQAKQPLNFKKYGSADRREIDCTGMEYLKGITEVKSVSRTTLLNNTLPLIAKNDRSSRCP